jgi:polysaccharide chain length determinant protein (PEP-CTERM system associated)
MKPIQNLQMSDYLDILKKRILLIATLAGFTGVASFFFVRALPDVYESETVILVEAPKIPAEYVRLTTVGTIESRLATIEQQIKSRTRLEKIILDNNLYVDQLKNSPMEAVLEEMRRDINLSVIKSDAFRISYQSSDPFLAQKVTREIVSQYIEESLKDREQLSEGVSDFLEGQLGETEAKLREQEEKLGHFKRKYIGALPEQEAAILSTLDRLQRQFQVSTDSLNKLEEQKAYQERLYAEFKTLSSMKKNNAVPTSPENPAQANRLITELTSKKAQRDSLAGRYTPDHPDIRKLDLEISLLEKKLSSDLPVKTSSAVPSIDAKPAADPSEPDQLLAKAKIQADLDAIDRQITQAKKEQDAIRTEMSMDQARIDSVPQMEQMEKQITRDYDITKQHYQGMLAKKNEAEVAASLERRRKGEQFRILDPANLPQKPAKPDRLKLNLIGIFSGLCIGFVIALVLELQDGSVRTKHEVLQLTNLPILAIISPITAEVPES